jgi:SAM-dependent methyltransferase
VEFSRTLIETSGYDRPGFAARYHHYRPAPPRILLDTLCRYACTERPSLVVDLGCGTGLSTRAWAGRAERTIGIEPNPAMIAEAEPSEGVEYKQAFAQETGLENGCADIVTCSQSLHWMEPEPTLVEAARILRPGGVFAAYDYDWPPVVDPEVDAAFFGYQRRRSALRETHGIVRGSDKWSKEQHLERMRVSGHFRFCRELLLHSAEEGSADQIVGFAYSIGLPAADVEGGVEKLEIPDDELERHLRIAELEEVAHRVLADRTVPFLWGYRVRVGVR